MQNAYNCHIYFYLSFFFVHSHCMYDYLSYLFPFIIVIILINITKLVSVWSALSRKQKQIANNNGTVKSKIVIYMMKIIAYNYYLMYINIYN